MDEGCGMRAQKQAKRRGAWLRAALYLLSQCHGKHEGHREPSWEAPPRLGQPIAQSPLPLLSSLPPLQILHGVRALLSLSVCQSGGACCSWLTITHVKKDRKRSDRMDCPCPLILHRGGSEPAGPVCWWLWVAPAMALVSDTFHSSELSLLC